MMQRFRELDAGLVELGFPATSPWWLGTLECFCESGRRILVLRVGRRGGKSSTLCRVAVCEALWGDHSIPPGDVGVVAFVSVSRDESAQRLRTIEAILGALRVGYDRRGDTIELRDRPVVFKTFSASIAGVAGFTAICVIGDELAKWRDSDSGANPAREVCASLMPTVATQPHAPVFWSSSAFGLEDFHAELFSRGDTDHQLTATATTWEANPTISEATTHELEPDQKVWAREYAAIPQSTATSAFDPDAIAEAFRPLPEAFTPGVPIGVVDFSSGRSDAATWCLARWLWQPRVPRHLTETERIYMGPDHRGEALWRTVEIPVLGEDGKPVPNPDWKRPAPPLVCVEGVRAVDGSFWRSLPASELVAQMASDFSGRASCVIGDQRESYLVESEFARHGLRFVSIPWDNARKVAAVERIRRWLRERTLVLPDQPEPPKLRAELLNFQERITPSGSLTYAARGSGHDDRVALLVTAAMAEAEGLLPSSPFAPRRPAGLWNFIPIA